MEAVVLDGFVRRRKNDFGGVGDCGGLGGQE